MLSIRELVKRFGADNVFIISKAGPRMAKLSKAWLLEVMALEDITGFNPNNIHFSAKISGPRGKGRIAKCLGITHMIDDKDEALLSVYDALHEKGAKFPAHGQLFHFARSGSGTPPPCKKWCATDRPSQVIPVGTWNEVLASLNVTMATHLASTKHTQYRTMPTSPAPSNEPPEEPDSPWDSWIAELEYKAPESVLQIPAMPLLTDKHDSRNHRSKLELPWFPFPVAVTKMMSKRR
jgi:hypothetical protein